VLVLKNGCCIPNLQHERHGAGRGSTANPSKVLFATGKKISISGDLFSPGLMPAFQDHAHLALINVPFGEGNKI
jgi:hypothetical protein